MTTELSPQATGPSSEDAKRPPPLSRRAMAFMVIWFFGWPGLVYADLPSVIPPASTLEICLFCAGCLVWFWSFIAIYGALVDMAEARWPVVRPIRTVLGFLFGILRAFGGHHSS